MPVPTTSTVIRDLVPFAKALRDTADWQPFREGVTAHWLYGTFGEGASAVLLRYEPGARVPLHEHVGFEYMLVIDGDQFDESGAYPEGTFVSHPPGTRHSPGSVNGCVALLVYEKPVRFVDPA